MSWPVSATVRSYVLLTGDVSFARWGTDELLPSKTSYVISRATQRWKKTDEEYKQGSGVQSGRAQILHGVVWDVTVRDRTDVTPPQVGQTCLIVDMAGHIGTIGASYLAYVMDPNYEATLGQPGERTIAFERLFLIEG